MALQCSRLGPGGLPCINRSALWPLPATRICAHADGGRARCVVVRGAATERQQPRQRQGADPGASADARKGGSEGDRAARGRGGRGGGGDGGGGRGRGGRGGRGGGGGRGRQQQRRHADEDGRPRQQRSEEREAWRPRPPQKTDTDGTWRLFGVKVPAEADPGKDDLSVHAALRDAVGGRLMCGKQLPAQAVSMVRKSFDARKGKPKMWVYVVDVDASAAVAAGARRLEKCQGLQEWIPASDGGDAAALAADSSGGPHYIAAATAAAAPARGSAGAADAAGASGGEREPVVVIGAGPGGLFAALTAAEAGLKVVLLEKGQAVEQRGRDIGALFVRRRLNPESNLCYGEGGAGTWSDGKLTTRIGRNSDPVRRVLTTLHALGAPDSILVSGKPHMGTENLVRILKNFRRHLQALGVDVRFGASVQDLVVEGGRARGVVLHGGETLRASAVVLAPGHSARPLYERLLHHGVAMSAKPFALGFRIEHPQAWLDTVQYGQADAEGVMRGKGKLPVADYTLATNILDKLAAEEAAAKDSSGGAAASGGGSSGSSSSRPRAGGRGGGDGQQRGGRQERQQDGEQGQEQPQEQQPPPQQQPQGGAADGVGSAEGLVVSSGEGSRGVYSFCMCPGGQIVPTNTQEDELCINGMSFSKRSSPWCNSALVVTVRHADWAHLEAAHGPLAGVELQREFEREGARRGGGALVAPVQRVEDYLEGRVSHPSSLPPSSYRLGVRAAPLHDIYPEPMSAALRLALGKFDRQLPGFASSGEGLLHGVETRTSAPVRVERRHDDCCSVSVESLFPCGEGAGYAGGIVSAAVDGMRVGEAVVESLTGVHLGLGF